jgi:hypothetical protein
MNSAHGVMNNLEEGFLCASAPLRETKPYPQLTSIIYPSSRLAAIGCDTLLAVLVILTSSLQPKPNPIKPKQIVAMIVFSTAASLVKYPIKWSAKAKIPKTTALRVAPYSVAKTR